MMNRLLQSTFVAILMAASWLQAAAQRHPYVAIKVEVPFKFKVGSRSFRPGSYQLIAVGTNLMALKDRRERVVASLITRGFDAGAVAPATKVVFRLEKKNLYLSQIRIQDLSQALEIRGEELAIQSSAPPESSPTEVLLFGTRQSGLGMKH